MSHSIPLIIDKGDIQLRKASTTCECSTQNIIYIISMTLLPIHALTKISQYIDKIEIG